MPFERLALRPIALTPTLPARSPLHPQCPPLQPRIRHQTPTPKTPAYQFPRSRMRSSLALTKQQSRCRYVDPFDALSPRGDFGCKLDPVRGCIASAHAAVLIVVRFTPVHSCPLHLIPFPSYSPPLSSICPALSSPRLSSSSSSPRPSVSVQLWELDSMKESKDLTQDMDPSMVYACQFHPTVPGLIATAGTQDNELRLIDKATSNVSGTVAPRVRGSGVRVGAWADPRQLVGRCAHDVERLAVYKLGLAATLHRCGSSGALPKFRKIGAAFPLRDPHPRSLWWLCQCQYHHRHFLPALPPKFILFPPLFVVWWG